MPTAQVEGSLSIHSQLLAHLPERSSPVFRALPIWPRFDPNVHLDFVTENHDISIAIANHSQLLSPEVSHYRAKCRREDRPEITIKTKSYQVAHARARRSRPTQRRQSARQAEQSRQVTRCSCRARRSRSRPTHAARRQAMAQGRWSAASRRGTKRQVTRCSCRARRSRPTQRRQCARQVVRGVPTRN